MSVYQKGAVLWFSCAGLIAVLIVGARCKGDEEFKGSPVLTGTTRIATFHNDGYWGGEVAGIFEDGGCYVNEADAGRTIDNGPYCVAVGKIMGAGWAPPPPSPQCIEGWVETQELLKKCVSALQVLVPLDAGTQRCLVSAGWDNGKDNHCEMWGP